MTKLRPDLSGPLFVKRSGTKKREYFDKLSINPRRKLSPKNNKKNVSENTFDILKRNYLEYILKSQIHF